MIIAIKRNLLHMKKAEPANLVEHIRGYITVSNELESHLHAISRRELVEKDSFLHRPGRICTSTYFIVQGLVRIYYKKGTKEITDNFSAEGEWITSVYSFMKNVPDNCYIQTLENTHILSISLRLLEQCFSDFPEMERFGRMLISEYFVQQSERILSMQFHSARERYAYYKKNAGDKIHRLPVGMLASYLGMTRETLSRLRADKKIM